MFARQYGLSCVNCHSAFPKLNDFGKQFAEYNYRLPNWKDTTVKTCDDELALPAHIPLAVRAQAFVQGRDAETIDVTAGERTEADSDFQSPYLNQAALQRTALGPHYLLFLRHLRRPDTWHRKIMYWWDSTRHSDPAASRSPKHKPPWWLSLPGVNTHRKRRLSVEGLIQLRTTFAA